MALLNDTLNLLSQATEPRTTIAINTGLGVEWLAKVAQGKIKNPGVNDIETLNKYLKKDGKIRLEDIYLNLVEKYEKDIKANENQLSILQRECETSIEVIKNMKKRSCLI